MADQLISVQSDRGTIEPTPVTIMSGGAEVSLGGSKSAVDQGFTATPTGSTNGTALNRPVGANGIIFYLTSTDAVTYTIATAQPTVAPTLTISVAGTSYAQWSEQLGPNTNIYITAKTGNPLYRFI